MEMGARVAARRGVAAAYVAALETHAQMHPFAAGFQTFFAALGPGLYLFYKICNVSTFDLCHRDLLIVLFQSQF